MAIRVTLVFGVVCALLLCGAALSQELPKEVQDYIRQYMLAPHVESLGRIAQDSTRMRYHFVTRQFCSISHCALLLLFSLLLPWTSSTTGGADARSG